VGQTVAVPPASAVDRRQTPPGVAVPRRGIGGPRSVDSPQAPAVSPAQPVVEQPRHSTPAFRYPEVRDGSRSQTENQGSPGRTPAERRVMPPAPPATTAAPAVVPRPQPTAPPTNDVPRFRTPATVYGVPQNSPAGVSSRPQVVPRSGIPPSVAPAPAAAVLPAPRMTTPAPAPSIAVPRAAPATPTNAPPPAAPAHAAPAAPSNPPAAAPPSHAAPSHGAPPQSGGEGQAQSRRRG
jgi:hypothetical protein